MVAAGLDMRAEDLSTHCRPNAFEDYLRAAELRTTPLYGQLFARAAAQEIERVREDGRSVRHLRSLRTYAGWFAESSPLDRGRLFRLLPTLVPLPRLRDLDPRDLTRLLSSGTSGRGRAGSAPMPDLHPDPSWPDRGTRIGIAARALARWSEAVDAGRGSLGAGDGLAAFTRSPLLLPLAYHVDARSLLDARRRARAGDTAAALEASARALESCAAFLAFLEAKLRAA